MVDKDPEKMTMDEAAEALMAFFDSPTQQEQPVAEESPTTETPEPTPDGEQAPEVKETPPTPAGETEAAPPADDVKPTPTDVDATEARFAKLEEEMQRLRSENGRMRKIAAENAMLRRKVRGEPTKPEERARLDELTEDQRLALGDDVTEVLRNKLAQTDNLLAAMEERYQAQEQYLAEIRKREHEQRHKAMMDDVERQYGPEVWGEWKTERFKKWCDCYDPLTGERNGDLLGKIDENADSDAAIALLGNYLRVAGITPKAEQPASTTVRNAPASANVAQRPAAPKGTTSTPSAPVKQDKSVWTPQAIDAAFARADRDPAWAKSKEGVAVFDAIMNQAARGF